MKKLLFIFVVIFSISSFSQGIWKNVPLTINFKDIVINSEGYWTISDGGAFFYSFSDSSWISLNKAEGLSNSVVSAVAIDNLNNVWFGTENGFINVYNPETGNIKIIRDIAESDKLSKCINNITFKDNYAYISSDFGISLIHTKNYTFSDTYRKFGDFTADSKNFYTLIDDLVYVCNQEGLAIQKKGAVNLLAPESWNSYKLSNTPQKAIKYNNIILVATNNGIFKYENNNLIKFLLDGENISDIKVSGNDLFIISKNKIYSYNSSGVKELYANNNYTFLGLGVKDNTEFYISTEKNILKVKGSSAKSYKPEGIDLVGISSMVVDGNGALYCATGKDGSGKGVYKFANGKWDIIDKTRFPEMKDNDVFSVSVSIPNNEVYFHHWGHGVSIYKDSKITHYDNSNSILVGIPNDTKFVVVGGTQKDKNENLWILNRMPGDDNAFSILKKDNKWLSLTLKNAGINSIEPTDLVIDNNNLKWFIGRNRGGLYYFSDNNTPENITDDKWGLYNTSMDLNSDIVNCFAIDYRNEIWVGSNNGINSITYPQKAKPTISGIRKKKINCMAIDPLNRKWFGTPDGLYLTNSDCSSVLEEYNLNNSPLPSSNIVALAFDQNSGILYISTDRGMCYLKTTSAKPADGFDDLYVYPNPVEINNSGDNLITIDGLIKNSIIKILSASGELINEFETPGGRTATWNCRDNKGNLVSSGVYIIVAYDKEVNKVGKTKVAVLKK